jgi:hypothetical protein
LHNLTMAGIAGLFLAFGAASGYADGGRVYVERRLIEGRAAFVAPRRPSAIYRPGNHFGPGFNAPANPSKGTAIPGDVASTYFR